MIGLLQNLYPGDAWSSFIVRVLAEITLVTSVALLSGRLVASRHPALRHSIYVCALVCVLFAPLSTWALQHAGWSTFQISLSHEHSVVQLAASSRQLNSNPTVREPHVFWTVERARSLVSLAILLWLAGLLALLVRLVTGSRKISRLKSTALSIQSPKLDAAVCRLETPSPLRPISVRVSQTIKSPLVVGVMRPTVLVPEALLEQLNEDQLTWILSHEFTHVRQRDPLIGLIQRLVEATYWPHPFVHLLNRDLVRAREEVCDNVALHGTSAPQYANTLLTVALGMRSTAPIKGTIGLMTPPWKLEERVKGLLDPRRRLTTTMNTRHVALIGISLASATALIAGTRVVAAPNPANPQDTVEISARLNKKTGKVELVAKKFVKAAPRTQKQTFTVRVEPMSATVVEDQQGLAAKKLEAANFTIVADAVASTFKDQPKSITITTDKGEDKRDVTVQIEKLVSAAKNLQIAETSEKSARTAETMDEAVKILNSTISKDVLSKVSEKGNQPLQLKVLLSQDDSDGVKKLNLKADAVMSEEAKKIQSDPTTSQIIMLQAGKEEPSAKVFSLTLQDGKPVGGLKLHQSSDNPVPEIKRLDLNTGTQGEVKYYKLVKPSQIKSQTLTLSAEDAGKYEKFFYSGPSSKAGSSQTIHSGSADLPSEKPTTIYIDGQNIRIVGDNVRVVYANKLKQPSQALKKSKKKVAGKNQ